MKTTIIFIALCISTGCLLTSNKQHNSQLNYVGEDSDPTNLPWMTDDVIRHDEESKYIKKLLDTTPGIITVRLTEMSDVRVADVISTVVNAMHDSTNVCIVYRAKQKSWFTRQLMSDKEFVTFLGRRPTTYWCVVYLHAVHGIRLYYRIQKNECIIFMLDYTTGETKEELLPPDVREFPTMSIPLELRGRANIRPEGNGSDLRR